MLFHLYLVDSCCTNVKKMPYYVYQECTKHQILKKQTTSVLIFFFNLCQKRFVDILLTFNGELVQNI